MKSVGWLIRDGRQFHAILEVMRVRIFSCSPVLLTAMPLALSDEGEREMSLIPYYAQMSVTYAGKTDKTCQRPDVSLVSIVAMDDKQTMEVIWSQDKQAAMIEKHGLEFSAACLFVLAFDLFFSYLKKHQICVKIYTVCDR